MSMLRNSLLAVRAFAAFGAYAHADTLKYKAALSGAGEVPATTSKGVGAIEADYDSATKTLTWSGSYADLTGPAVAAHFHGPAAAGVNAGVLVPVDANRRSGQGLRRRPRLFQRPHRRQQGRRTQGAADAGEIGAGPGQIAISRPISTT